MRASMGGAIRRMMERGKTHRPRLLAGAGEFADRHELSGIKPMLRGKHLKANRCRRSTGASNGILLVGLSTFSSPRICHRSWLDRYGRF